MCFDKLEEIIKKSEERSSKGSQDEIEVIEREFIEDEKCLQ